jgi:hypothetical protein
VVDLWRTAAKATPEHRAHVFAVSIGRTFRDPPFLKKEPPKVVDQPTNEVALRDLRRGRAVVALAQEQEELSVGVKLVVLLDPSPTSTGNEAPGHLFVKLADPQTSGM